MNYPIFVICIYDKLKYRFKALIIVNNDVKNKN